MRLGLTAWVLRIILVVWGSQGLAAPFTFETRGMKLQRELVATDIGPVWAMVFLPDGDLLMTIRTGTLKKYQVDKKTFTTLPGAPSVAIFGQGGLLDIALSANFVDDRLIYLSYSKEVSKGLYSTAVGMGEYDGKALNNFREIFVAKGSSGKPEHFGGRLVVESSAIFLTVGERGERANAQQLENHLGKILRLTLDGKAHPDNPFIKRRKALAEIYSYGHRNPQGLVRNPLTGELWEHEHGPMGGDEINIIKKGLNYGWPNATYGREYWGTAIGQILLKGTESPIHQWTPSIAPCGMIIYSSNAMPGWKGLIISGSLAKTHLNLIEITKDRMVMEERLFTKDAQRVREVEQGPNGDIWYATDNGSLYRIRKISND